MLAERVKEWTQEWKQEGYEEGLRAGVEQGLDQAVDQLRGTVLRKLEQRFGRLNEESRRKLNTLQSQEELLELALQAVSASSLASLGLASD